jgi:hypothetical protein
MTESWMKRSEKAIHDLCNHFGKELSDQQLHMYQEINSWRDALIRQIEEHARDQIGFLKQEYQKQKNHIENIRRQFLDATRPLERTGNNEQVDQLLSQCRALKFELAALEFPERSIPFIQFMTEEQLVRKKQTERKTEKKEDNQSRSDLVGGYDNYNMSNAGAYVNVASKLMSGHMDHTK